MKTLRLFLLLVGLAGSISHAHAADAVTVKGILISASNEPGESDRRLAAYVPNLKRILRFESFHYLGEHSASLAVPAKGELSLGDGQLVALATESADGKTVLLRVRWGSVRHEYVLEVKRPTKRCIPVIAPLLSTILTLMASMGTRR